MTLGLRNTHKIWLFVDELRFVGNFDLIISLSLSRLDTKLHFKIQTTIIATFDFSFYDNYELFDVYIVSFVRYEETDFKIKLSNREIAVSLCLIFYIRQCLIAQSIAKRCLKINAGVVSLAVISWELRDYFILHSDWLRILEGDWLNMICDNSGSTSG